MNTGAGNGPREHFSSVLSKNIIRNEHWRRKVSKRTYFITFDYECNKNCVLEEERKPRDFSSLFSMSLREKLYWRRKGGNRTFGIKLELGLKKKPPQEEARQPEEHFALTLNKI